MIERGRWKLLNMRFACLSLRGLLCKQRQSQPSGLRLLRFARNDTRHFMRYRLVELTIALTTISALCNCASGDEFLKATDFKVFDRPASTMMSDYLTALVDEQFAKRAALLVGLKTAEDWGQHAAIVRNSMAAWIGELLKSTRVWENPKIGPSTRTLTIE